jgi:hypothetical protein
MGLFANLRSQCNTFFVLRIPREKLEQDLANLHGRILDICEQTRRLIDLDGQISKTTTGRISEHELWFRYLREETITSNQQLIADLLRQEKKLKEKLGIT